jgi:hypothetical protein
MISPLTDLETRRKILFADDDFTIRSLGIDSILVTMNSKRISQNGIEKIRAFLYGRTQSVTINSLIVDISQASSLALVETLAFSKMKEQGFQRFAVLSRKFRLRLLIPFLLPYTGPTRFKLFKDLTSAIAWTRHQSDHN